MLICVCRQVFDFTLEAEEIKSITALNKGWRYIVPMIQVSTLWETRHLLSVARIYEPVIITGQVKVNTNTLLRAEETVSTLVLMLQVDGERVPRDAGHPHYPFNDPYWPSTLHPESVPSTAPPTPHSPPISLINVPGSWHRSLSLDSVKSCTYH